MTYGWVARTLAALTISVSGLVSSAIMTTTSTQQASAVPCPDIEVIFARGSGEPPGVGGVGQAFVDAVRAQSGGRSVAVYPVNYAASSNFSDRAEIARTIADGIRNETAHLQSTVAACPSTRVVLGGYSQGAALTALLTEAVQSAGIADHVAAVVFFGKPAGELVPRYSVPSIAVGPRYASRTLDLCAPGDAVCEGQLNGPRAAHRLYPVNGMVSQGAAYAMGRV
ncbi:MAG: Cutinase [Mycobacterium sp.]|nr:Cutinase [Mycobacterium sp.]